jgi:hypothetical protein
MRSSTGGAHREPTHYTRWGTLLYIGCAATGLQASQRAAEPREHTPPYIPGGRCQGMCGGAYTCVWQRRAKKSLQQPRQQQ